MLQGRDQPHGSPLSRWDPVSTGGGPCAFLGQEALYTHPHSQKGCRFTPGGSARTSGSLAPGRLGRQWLVQTDGHPQCRAAKPQQTK